MYLVMLRYAMDDFPIRLVATQDEAIQIATEISWDVPENVGRVLSIDASIPSSICVYQFDGDGELRGARVIRSFDGDDDEFDSVA